MEAGPLETGPMETGTLEAATLEGGALEATERDFWTRQNEALIGWGETPPPPPPNETYGRVNEPKMFLMSLLRAHAL